MSPVLSPDLGALLPIFDALPAPYLLLSPALTIEAVSDAYLAAILTQRASLIGRNLFDAFPDDDAAPHFEAARSIRASLKQVLATGQPHEVAAHRYDVPAPARLGHFEERYWLPRNTPVLDAQGQVLHIIHAITDVTGQRQAAAGLLVQQAQEQATYAATNEERQQLYQLFQEAPAMISVLEGPQHVFQFVNPPYQTLVGDRPIVGKPLAEAMPELAGQPFFELLDRVYQTGETYYANEMLVQLDFDNRGTHTLGRRYYNFIYQARHNRAGAIDGIFVFAYEVTPQVVVRREMEALNEELAAINEELHASNEEYLTANTALSEAQQQLRQLNQELEARVQRRTNEALASQADVLATAQELRLITDSLPVLISYLDAEQRYRFVNQAYQAWFNQRPADLLGRPVREVVGEQAYQAARPYIERALAGERLEFESRMPYREGFTKYIHTTYVPAERAGEAAGFYTLTFDITEQALARQQVQALNDELTATNDELHQSNTRLLRTNADLDTFVYTASHDLKAPITNVEGLLLALRAQLPADVQEEETVANILHLLRTNVSRFRFTITQLTDVARLQQAQAGPAEPVALAELVKNVCFDLAGAIEDAAATVHVAIAPDLSVLFTPANLRSIVYNLLSNALKYRQPAQPAQVWLRAEREPDAVVFSVQDNGLGLTESQQTRLFGVFQRLHTHVEGTGVGLYMIKRLIENAGATIAVTSQPQVGSTFTVTFPL